MGTEGHKLIAEAVLEVLKQTVRRMLVGLAPQGRN